jgi:hypothetical protein
MSNLSPPPVLSATILSGAALSSVFEVAGARAIGLQLPTITSAVISFQGSFDGTTFADCVDSAGAEITLGTATVGGKFYFLPATLGGPPFLKVRSGTSAAPVNQGADRVLQLVAKWL